MPLFMRGNKKKRSKSYHNLIISMTAFKDKGTGQDFKQEHKKQVIFNIFYLLL